ncbi:kinase-like domain-containing protein [Trametes maxima]|nr:kinase-like domain-containing protein [Trametes maxima]
MNTSHSVASVVTQQATQSTQEASQTDNLIPDADLWGILVPCSMVLPRHSLYKSQKRYRVGRNPDRNEIDIVLSGLTVSKNHCFIEWDGDEGPNAAVKVVDSGESRNGTFVNGKKIRPGQSVLLRDGNEIAFGSMKPQPAEGGVHDYRFMYRHVAYTSPNRGVHSIYDIQHELGKGSFAPVMKALHREEGRWYAIKIIQGEKLPKGWYKGIVNGCPTDEESRKLIREISILERLQHRNICQLKEVFLERYKICLVLELVPGGDLLRLLLQKERRQQYIRITHRDLKLENVLLTQDVPPVVKVADFGLAKVVDTLTTLYTVCGTPTYLAPEVRYQGPNGYDHLVDSWSVGVITCIMLTMELSPFVKVEDDGTAAQYNRIDWALLHKHHVSEQGHDFIRKLQERDPQRRMTLEDACHHPWLNTHRLPPDVRPPAAPAEHRSSVNTVGDMDGDLDSPPKLPPLHGNAISDLYEGGEPLTRMGDCAGGENVVAWQREGKRKVADRSDASLIPRAQSEVANDVEMAGSPADGVAVDMAKPGRGKSLRGTARNAGAKRQCFGRDTWVGSPAITSVESLVLAIADRFTIITN